jgi:hypothetical protein
MLPTLISQETAPKIINVVAKLERKASECKIRNIKDSKTHRLKRTNQHKGDATKQLLRKSLIRTVAHSNK